MLAHFLAELFWHWRHYLECFRTHFVCSTLTKKKWILRLICIWREHNSPRRNAKISWIALLHLLIYILFFENYNRSTRFWSSLRWKIRFHLEPGARLLFSFQTWARFITWIPNVDIVFNHHLWVSFSVQGCVVGYQSVNLPTGGLSSS